MTIRLVAERPEHAEAIEGMLDRAFGPGRFAKSSERVRERGAVFEPLLSRVALDDNGDVAGCCRIWRVRVGATPLYFLGPLAVDPGAQHKGLGALLAREATEACRHAGGGGVLLVGAAPFFEPLGFALVPPGRVRLPGPADPARLLWIELRPGALDAVKGDVERP